MNLQAHLYDYDIHCFPDRHGFERWAKEQLGHRWRQRLDEAHADLRARNPSREAVRKTFDSTAHTSISRVNLSRLYAAELGVGDAITKLITGRKRVLDLGCNIGHLTTWYARIDPARHVTGIDFSLACVVAARQKALKMGLTNVEFEVKDIEACELSGTYDAIVETLCLKYVKDIEKVLRHLASLLEPQGILVTSTPPDDPPKRPQSAAPISGPFLPGTTVRKRAPGGQEAGGRMRPGRGGPLSLLVRPGRMPGHHGRCLISTE
jgi:2-polyprenyl-3-methyl-5-hydroxy-6-metoxy-1,4-benzoquinol methylase